MNTFNAREVTLFLALGALAVAAMFAIGGCTNADASAPYAISEARTTATPAA